MTDLKKIYKGKKVLVTGNTGFKGSWLSVWLTELGAEVTGYAIDPPSVPNMFEAINLKDKITHVKGDVRGDGSRLGFVLEHMKPEFVFHLAAQPIVRRSYKEPRLTYETNIMGTVNLLEAVRKTDSVRACVIVTSDKCYENREWVFGYRETDPMGGHDPYSSSKGCAELVTAAYRKSYSLPVSTVRAGNVIGGGDWGEDRLVPDCIKSLASNKQMRIRSLEAIRPWQYVLEPLLGYLTLAALMYQRKSKYSGAWNFGPTDESLITVNELVRCITSYWYMTNYWCPIDASDHFTQPHEASLLKLDTSKARALLGWKPVYTIYESIEKAVAWYTKFYHGREKEDLYKYTVDQIKEYEEVMK